MSEDTDTESEENSTESWVPLEERETESSPENLQPFGGVTGDENDPRSSADEEWEGDDDSLYPWASGRGSTSGDAPWLGESPPEETLEPGHDVPRYIEWIGQSGVYLGVGALFLALGGISLASADVQPMGNIAIVASLGTIFGAMFLGIVFQAYVSIGSS
jgi:hypothetical protein